MKKTCLPVVVVLALVLASGCNFKPKGKTETAVAPPAAGGGIAAPAQTPSLTPEETLAKQAIDLLNRATDLMNAVTDRAGAVAVAPQLKSIAQHLQELNRQGVPLGSQVHQNPQALGRLQGEMEKAVQRYADVAVRMLAQENVLGPEFQEALREFGKLPQ